MTAYPTTKATTVATRVLAIPGSALALTSGSWKIAEATTAGMASRNAYRVAASRR